MRHHDGGSTNQAAGHVHGYPLLSMKSTLFSLSCCVSPYLEICAQRSPSSERRTADQWGRTKHSVGLLGVPVEEFELDLDHVVEALAPLVDVVVAAVTAVHFAGG